MCARLESRTHQEVYIAIGAVGLARWVVTVLPVVGLAVSGPFLSSKNFWPLFFFVVATCHKARLETLCILMLIFQVGTFLSDFLHPMRMLTNPNKTPPPQPGTSPQKIANAPLRATAGEHDKTVDGGWRVRYC